MYNCCLSFFSRGFGFGTAKDNLNKKTISNKGSCYSSFSRDDSEGKIKHEKNENKFNCSLVSTTTNSLLASADLSFKLEKAVVELTKYDLADNPSDKEIGRVYFYLLASGMLLFDQFAAENYNNQSYNHIKELTQNALATVPDDNKHLLFKNISLIEHYCECQTALNLAMLPLYCKEKMIPELNRLEYNKSPSDNDIKNSHKYFKALILMLSTVRFFDRIAAGGRNNVLPVTLIDGDDGGFYNRNTMAALTIACRSLAQDYPNHDLFNKTDDMSAAMQKFMRHFSSITSRQHGQGLLEFMPSDNEYHYPSTQWDSVSAYISMVKDQIDINQVICNHNFRI